MTNPSSGSTCRNARNRCVRLRFETLEPRLALTGVVINEFLALNNSGLQDADGDRSDWIELYNDSPAPVDLADWRLTDDDGDLDKWTLPGVTIAPNEYLVVFASGKDRAIAGQELHTNFSLNGAGESLALVDPLGVVRDAYNPFPEQQEDVSYGRGAAVSVAEPLVDENSSASVLVPTTASDAPGLGWTETLFDDSAWLTGSTGVGYERSPGGAYDYTSLIELDLNSEMPAGRNSAYVRLEFHTAGVEELTDLTLGVRYDDGFVAYLNGVEIARRNAPASPSWNSTATDSHGDSAAVLLEEIDATPFLGALEEGANVLAIHGLQRNNSSDFLIDPILLASRAIDAQVAYMASPTPGAPNSQGTLGFVEDTTFSVDRGIYEDPFEVLIETATPGATIRYTLDGSTPTATSGTVYDPFAPPQIATTTVLRAAAFKAGFTPTNTDTQTYLFLEDVLHQDGAGLPAHANWGWQGPDWELAPEVVDSPAYNTDLREGLQEVPSVSLVMPWDDWFGGGGEGIYISGSNIERQGSIEYFNAPGGEEFQIDGALEIQGGTSDDRWKTDKLSIRATFKEPFGPTKLDADLFETAILGDGATDRFDTFILDAQINYTWAYGGSVAPTDQRGRAKLIQDQYVADLQNLMGGQAPHGRFVHLYINGLYWGLYNLHERPDDSFAEEYLGGDRDDYDVIKHSATRVVSGGATASSNYASMLGLVRQDLSDPANYAAAVAEVDVDDLIDYMILNYYVGNTDWAHHNWYATHNRVDPEGKWRFHSWDAEHVLKGLNDNVTLSGGSNGSPEEIHVRLLENDEYRLRFSDLVQQRMTGSGLLTPDATAAVYQDRMDEVHRAIVGESARWGDSHTTSSEPPGAGNSYTRDHWLATQQDLFDNYFPYRTDVVLSQFEARGWLAALDAPTLSHNGGTVPQGFTLTLQKPAGAPATATLYYTLHGGDPRLPGGGVSPSAIEASGDSAAIIIESGVRVRARLFDPMQPGASDDWSAELDETFLVETLLPLRITELHYHPAETPGVEDSGDLEFIEIQNTGAQTISLDGISLTGFASDPYVFSAGQTLGPGERLVVARSPAVFASVYGAGVNLAPEGYANANLSNGGETVTLVGPFSQVLHSVAYDDEAGWPETPDGEGPSLEIIDPHGDANDPANWRPSAVHGGTPGATGLAIPQLTGDYDGNGAVEEADKLTWRAHYGTTLLTPGVGADGNGDGVVDAADYSLWRDHFGSSVARLTVADSPHTAVGPKRQEVGPATATPAAYSPTRTWRHASGSGQRSPLRLGLSVVADAPQHTAATLWRYALLIAERVGNSRMELDIELDDLDTAFEGYSEEQVDARKTERLLGSSASRASTL